MTSFHQRFLGKIYSVTFYLSVEDLSEENIAYMRTLRFPCFRFSCFFCAVFSEQRGHTKIHSRVLDAPSKLDNAKLSSDDRPKIVNRWFILILRKEVIQPHLPIRLPCYDFTPVTFPTLDGCAGFGCERLPWCDGRCVQDPGTYSPQYADLRLLAIPTSCRRVAACNPN